MPSRERATDLAAAQVRRSIAELLHELRTARLDRGLSGKAVGRAVGLSHSQYSRIERGLATELSIQKSARLLSAVGLRLSVRVFPAGQPIRDAGHARLLDRFRAQLHHSLRFRTEVPFPEHGDLRAWDAVVAGRGWRLGVEAETRPRDRQALERRLAMKLRDGEVDHLALLLLNSRHNREFLRDSLEVLRERFPVPGSRALQQLATGMEPEGSSIILL